MKITFVRHGESEANVASLLNDDPTQIINLTTRGICQAENASNILSAVRFAAAYVSEYPRAKQTAEILLRQQTCSLQIDTRINERLCGMNGQPVRHFVELVRPDRLRIKPKGGESFLELMERMRDFLDEISLRHGNENILAVSHGAPVLAALALTFKNINEVACHKGIANCEIVEFSWPLI